MFDGYKAFPSAVFMLSSYVRHAGKLKPCRLLERLLQMWLYKWKRDEAKVTEKAH